MGALAWPMTSLRIVNEGRRPMRRATSGHGTCASVVRLNVQGYRLQVNGTWPAQDIPARRLAAPTRVQGAGPIQKRCRSRPVTHPRSLHRIPAQTGSQHRRGRSTGGNDGMVRRLGCQGVASSRTDQTVSPELTGPIPLIRPWDSNQLTTGKSSVSLRHPIHNQASPPCRHHCPVAKSIPPEARSPIPEGTFRRAD